MSAIIHLANTNMELELVHSSPQSIELSLSRHSLCLQLQFLPILYAQPEDLIAVTALPSQEHLDILRQVGWLEEKGPQFVLLKDYEPFRGKKCFSWGPSLQVQSWAQARQVSYECPNWKIVQLVNSKAFSFRYSCLPDAALIHHEQQLHDWLQKIQGNKVLKSCFGLSGNGNRIIQENKLSSQVLAFCQKEWWQKRPIVGEPWLDRLLDFSTQWFIHPDRRIEFIGATLFETDDRGVYQGTLAGLKIFYSIRTSLF